MNAVKKIVLILMIVMSNIIAVGQSNATAKNIPLSLKIVAICEKITATENNPLLLLKYFFSDSAIAEHSLYYNSDFKQDTLYRFHENVFEHLMLSRLYDSLNKSKFLYEVFIKLKSRYEVINRTKDIQYDTTNKVNISYEELNAYLGKPLPKSHFQPMEHKYYYYMYTNPVTHNKAIVIIDSYNPAGASYNIVLSIRIANASIHKILEKTENEKKQ